MRITEWLQQICANTQYGKMQVNSSNTVIMLKYLEKESWRIKMEFSGFPKPDFDVFLIDGLEGRMEMLKERIRPKLEYLGQYFAPELSALTGDEMFAHVAKHARRTKNPPNDTWVAFANNARGYKMLPHFQIGLWNSHLFIWFAVIYESPQKQTIGRQLERNCNDILSFIPTDFVWSADHTKPDSISHGELSKDQLLTLFENLQTVKKAEILCGYVMDQETVAKMKPDILLEKIDQVFRKLIPLYTLTTKAQSPV
jgi:uncharacterized protein YktB (UPF0637 family)